MIDTARIKEHMEVVDSAGRHIGTVDRIIGERIKLTARNALDGQHHHVDTNAVERIDGDRLVLRADAMTGARDTTMSEAEIAAGSQYHATSSPLSGAQDRPLFGTSGNGTGMGGSGSSQH